MSKIEEAQAILSELGLPDAQRNETSMRVEFHLKGIPHKSI